MLVDIDVDQETVLESLRTFHAEYLRREQGLVLLAVHWAKLNPGLQRTLNDGTPNYSSAGVDPEDLLWEELAAKGCPHMDDLTIPAFSVAAGITEFQARKLIRESLMLVYLLPRVWKRTSQGQIDVWRARKLAEECWDLTPEAVDYVDRLMSLTTARHTQSGRAGVVAEARLRYMPEVVEEEQKNAQETRGFTVSTEEWGSAGVASVWGTLDLPDALELEKAIAAGAETLKTLGSDAPLDVRRSWALGDLARASQVGTPSLYGDSPPSSRNMPQEIPKFLPNCACALGLHPPGRSTPPAQVMMYLHLAPDSFDVGDPELRSTVGSPAVPPQGSWDPESQGRAVPGNSCGVVRVEGTGASSRIAVSSDVVRSWLTRPTGVHGPKVIFRPVINLNNHEHVEAYEVPERLKEHAALRDGTCVFPWCTRVARRSDCDHTVAWKEEGDGGPTCTCNLAPLCRFHHRAKTHADNHVGNRYAWWNYESLGEGKYLWSGPKGTVLLRTNAGVFDVSNEHTSNGPKVPYRGMKRRTLAGAVGKEVELDGRVRAAERAIKRISVALPEPLGDTESVEPLEFPVQEAPARELSWRQKILRAPVEEDPPDVIPGSLAERVVNREVERPSAMATRLEEHLTRRELFSTPQEREVWNFFRELAEDAGIYIPPPIPTRVGNMWVYEQDENPSIRFTNPKPRSSKKVKKPWDPEDYFGFWKDSK